MQGITPGARQLHADPRPAQLQDRASTSSTCNDTRAVPLTVDLHVPDGRRVPGGQGRHGAARLHDVRAGHRRPELRDEQQAVQRVLQDDWRAGREPQAALRLPLRRLLLSRRPTPTRRSRTRRSSRTTPTTSARALGVAWTLGAKKDQVIRASTGHHVRPAAARHLRERDPAERAAGADDLFGERHRASARPAFPNTLSNLPAGAVLPAQTIFAPDPDLKLAYNIQNSAQYDARLRPLVSTARSASSTTAATTCRSSPTST